MGVWEIITGKQPLMKSMPAGKFGMPGTSTTEDEISSLLNRKFIPVSRVQTNPLKGTYDSLAAANDYALAKRGSGDLQSIRQLVIPVAVAGEVIGSPFQLGECTGILLAPRICGDNGIESESSESARIYLQINNSGVWVPFSFNLFVVGSQKGDAQFVAGPIATLRVQVVNITQDPVNQPNVYLWLMRGITVVGQFGAAVGYGPPLSSNIGGAPSTQVTTSGGAETAGGGQSGGGQSGGGGTSGGGGGGGGTGGGGGGGGTGGGGGGKGGGGGGLK